MVATKINILALIVLSLVAFAFYSGILATAEQANIHETSSTAPASGIELKGVNICFECHDVQQTIGFHYPGTIMRIEEKKGQRRRICIDCHGSEGTDPDRSMTNPSLIEWDEEKGYFKVDLNVVHGIHRENIDTGIMECATCHFIKDNDPTQLGDSLVAPKPNPGQVLVCQICHLPSDPGNYIKIHIVSGHQECNTCHTGELKDIHKRATASLGRVD